MKLLKDLYYINSPSGRENGLSGYVGGLLNSLHINFNRDKFYQIYSLSNPSAPIICCHMDQVGNRPLTKISHKNGIITADRNIGADDKNGLWLCLSLLKKYPDTNFIFSTCEEIGGNIDRLLQKIDISSFPYALVFDRRGCSDIIGYDNGYCSKEFQNAIAEIGHHYGYSPSRGIYSDCDKLSQYVNCVNLSCGYYNAHTDKEYTVIKELKTALSFAIAILDDFIINNTSWPLIDPWELGHDHNLAKMVSPGY